MSFDPQKLLRAAMNNDVAEIDRISQQLQVNRVSLAHGLLMMVPWEEINRVLPDRRMNYLTAAGWIRSIECNSSVNSDGAPIPWIVYSAIDFLESIAKKSWRVFEWGTGNSTRWWASHVQEVVAVEDDPHWSKVFPAHEFPNVKFLSRPDPKSYIEAIEEFPDHYFDVVVVDGSHRMECARRAVKKLSEKGLVLFDNTEHAEYEPVILELQKTIPCRLDFWGLIPIYIYKNCTSVFFRDTSVMANLPPPLQASVQSGLILSAGRRST